MEFGDLPTNVILMIIELAFLHVDYRKQDFNGVTLRISRPESALIHTCRALYNFGKLRFQKLTRVGIDGGGKDRQLRDWTGAKNLLRQCPEGASILELYEFEDHAVIKKICQNMKFLECVKWQSASRFDIRQLVSTETSADDILALLRQTRNFEPYKRLRAELVGRVPCLELKFGILCRMACEDDPTVSHYLDGVYTLRLGTDPSFFRSAKYHIFDVVDNCKCIGKCSSGIPGITDIDMLRQDGEVLD